MQRTMLNTNTRYDWTHDTLKKTDTWFGKKTDKYTAVFRAYGNIDHGEDPDREICLPLEIWANDIGTIQKAFIGFIHSNALGAGNISSVLVYRNNYPVARIFFNGRVENLGD